MMRYEIKRTNDEVNSQMDKAVDKFDSTASPFADGVLQALGWIIGDTDDLPMEEVTELKGK